MNKTLFFLLLGLFLAAGCQPDDDDDEPTTTGDGKGDVFVQVFFNGQPVEEASVYTDPETIDAVTDDLGSVLLEGVPVANYRVFADRAPLGRGVAAVMVDDNNLMQVRVDLLAGQYVTPSLTLNTETGQFQYDINEEITLIGMVADDSAPESFTISIASSLDGELGEVQAGTDGSFSFVLSGLTEGFHTITAITADEDGLEASRQLSVQIVREPEPVVFDSVAVVDGQMKLYWQESPEASFSEYRVLRSGNGSEGFFSEIARISDRETTTYVDTEIDYAQVYHYKIQVRLENNGFVDSEILSGRYVLEGIDLLTGIVRLKADPSRPYLYGLDRVNNNLLFINTDTRSLEKTIFVGSAPADIAISLDNSVAYVANYGSSQIALVDLETQEKIRDIVVDTNVGTWDGNPYRLAVLSGNRLAYTSEDQWNSIKVVNADNGVNLFNGGSIYQPGLVTNSDGTVLYATESGSSGSSAIRYNLEGNTLREVSSSNSSTNYSLRDACLTSDDQFLYYNGAKLLASNLNTILGTINDRILACTDSGDIVVGERNIWDGESFAIISAMVFTPDLAVVPRGSRKAYLYSDATSQIVIIDLPE